MADWTTISNSQVAPKAPVTSELMTALRDNPQAIAEGSTGAPKVEAPALQQNTIVLTSLTDDDFVEIQTTTGNVLTTMVWNAVVFGGDSEYAYTTSTDGTTFSSRVSLIDNAGNVIGTNYTGAGTVTLPANTVAVRLIINIPTSAPDTAFIQGTFFGEASA